jgi:3-phenylpropionate/trans-cinnamate dioxygenase ferredoxin subunit
MKWSKLAEKESDLEEILGDRDCSPFDFSGSACLLIKHQGAFYLVKNKCPHQGQKLDNAKCEDGFIVCPWHRYGFDLKTGRGGGLYLENYPIEIRADGVYAGVEYFSWFGE